MKSKTFFKILLSFICVFIVGIVLAFFKIYDLTQENKILLKDIEDIEKHQAIDNDRNCTKESTIVYDLDSLRTVLDRAAKQTLDGEQ